jgi:hypothetical protein
MSELQTPSRPFNPEAMVMTFDAEEMMAVVVRLAEILEQESTMIMKMNTNSMGQLHPEKLRYTQMLESYQALLRARPDIIEDLPDEVRDRLLNVIAGFSSIMEHNFRQVAAAKIVNQRVVQAITDSIAGQQHLTVYNKTGNHFYAGAQQSGISINLNQKA